MAGWAGWPIATILLATVARSWWPAQLMEYFQESGSSLSQLRETSAASQQTA